MTITSRSIACGVAAMFVSTLFTAAAVTPANAATAERSVHVRYGDLDLASDQGRATLDHRIVRAARIVCGDGEARLIRPETERCERTAIARAKANLYIASFTKRVATGLAAL